MGSEIAILRLGHRPQRDKRITTHVALVGRAFGARSILISEKDAELEQTIGEVVEKFGGDFSVETGINWKRIVRDWDGPVVHLTMYGEPIEKAMNDIQKGKVLVVVGAEKVPPEVFGLADFNISITNQPHSEVAALAIFLDRITEARWAESNFEGKRIIVPSKERKIIIDMLEGYLGDEECGRILKGAGCQEDIIKHSESVARIAVKIAKLCEADVDLVRTAAMLHDIGRSKTHGPEHGYEGAVILRELSFPEKIVSIVERHVGGGLDSDEAEMLGLPRKDRIPISLEEKIVCIADKLIEDNERVSIEREVGKLKEKGLDGAAKRVEILYSEMEQKCGIDLDEVSL
jgi:tRNA (cytidine56-2'-O)-methyltransferase